MFDVTLDPDVLEGLAARLELWAGELSNAEWAHLLGLLALGSAALAEAVGGVGEQPGCEGATEVAAMESPGFADALSPAADAVLTRAAVGRSVVIASVPELNRWAVTSVTLHPRTHDATRSGPPVSE